VYKHGDLTCKKDMDVLERVQEKSNENGIASRTREKICKICCRWSRLPLVAAAASGGCRWLRLPLDAAAAGCGCRWSRLPLVAAAAGRGCRWSRLPLVTDAAGCGCRWSRMPRLPLRSC
jgi:hypothetical protein